MAFVHAAVAVVADGDCVTGAVLLGGREPFWATNARPELWDVGPELSRIGGGNGNVILLGL